MIEKPKIPRSFVQKDILSSLIYNKSLTFTELQKITNVSRPTLSTHLSQLTKKKIIKSIKKGRSKYYSLVKSNKTQFEKEIITLLTHYKLDFIIELEERKKPVKVQDEYKNIGNWISSYLLFLIIKSLKTGKNWTSGVVIEDLIFIVTNYIASLLFNKPTHGISERDKFSTEINTQNFINMNELITKLHLDNDIDTMDEVLNKAYPNNMKVIKRNMELWVNQVS